MKLFSIRSLFSHPTRREDLDSMLYEERVTLWFSENLNKAVKKAEAEALVYGNEAGALWHGVMDSFQLFDEDVKDGIEVWFEMRDSRFNADQYRDTFIMTNRDRVK